MYMSHVVALKKDGSEAIIPKVKMATSRLLFTFLLSPWQAVLNEQASHSLSPLHTVLLRVLLLLLLPMLRSQWLEGIERWRRAKLCPVLTVVRGELERGESTVPRRPVHRGVQALC